MMTTRQMWATFVLVWLTLSHEGILDIEPRATIWVTWASASGIKDFCLSLQQADDPFQTCLIGIPLWENETDFDGYWKQQRVNLISSQNDDSCFISNWPSMRNAAWQKTVIENLNQLTSLPLQELDLLAGVTPVEYINVTRMQNCDNAVPQLQPVNGTGVVWFGDPWHIWLAQNGRQDLFVGYQNVTGHSSWSDLKTGGFSVKTTGGFKLPPGVFLICGDRAWPGIPIRPVGGPCCLGRLTLFAAHMRELLNPSKSQGEDHADLFETLMKHATMKYGCHR